MPAQEKPALRGAEEKGEKLLPNFFRPSHDPAVAEGGVVAADDDVLDSWILLERIERFPVPHSLSLDVWRGEGPEIRIEENHSHRIHRLHVPCPHMIRKALLEVLLAGSREQHQLVVAQDAVDGNAGTAQILDVSIHPTPCSPVRTEGNEVTQEEEMRGFPSSEVREDRVGGLSVPVAAQDERFDPGRRLRIADERHAASGGILISLRPVTPGVPGEECEQKTCDRYDRGRPHRSRNRSWKVGSIPANFRKRSSGITS